MLEMGKRYKWKQISETYPNMWAIITDIKETDWGGIDSCKLLAIATNDTKMNYLDYFYGKGLSVADVRTTFKMPSGGMLC